jgi:hypothetical protein
MSILRLATVSMLPVLFPLVAGWSKFVHDAMGWTSMSALRHSYKLKKLLSGKDTGDVGYFYDISNPKSSSEFFSSMQKVTCEDPASLNTKFGLHKELISAIKQFHEDTGVSKGDKLIMLTNYIGELHAPSHFYTAEINQEALKKSFSDPSTSRGNFETKLVDDFITHTGTFWYSGWTNAGVLPVSLRIQEVEKYQKDFESAIQSWGKETADVYCKYLHGTDKLQSELFPVYSEILKKQVILGGFRMAIVLDLLLDKLPASLRVEPNRLMESDDEVLLERGGYTLVTNLGVVLTLVILVALFLRNNKRLNKLSNE